jgi:hypothetical protein
LHEKDLSASLTVADKSQNNVRNMSIADEFHLHNNAVHLGAGYSALGAVSDQRGRHLVCNARAEKDDDTILLHECWKRGRAN